jgi:hypothetical protein
MDVPSVAVSTPNCHGQAKPSESATSSYNSSMFTYWRQQWLFIPILATARGAQIID